MNTTRTLLFLGLVAVLATSCVTRQVKTVRLPSVIVSKADPVFYAISPGQTIDARKLLEPMESVMREQGFQLVPQKEARYIAYSGFRGVISKNHKFGVIVLVVFPLREGGAQFETKDVWEGAVRLTGDDFTDPRDAIRTLLAKFGTEFEGALPTPQPQKAN